MNSYSEQKIMHKPMNLQSPIKLRESKLLLQKLQSPVTSIRRSNSVSSILHGEPSSISSHYIDSLQRFHRDHASHDKHSRELASTHKQSILQNRRLLTLQRESINKLRQQHQYNKLLDQNKKSLQIYKSGNIRNSFVGSIPVNPINQRYQQTQHGKQFRYKDQERKIGGLVRTHHLLSCGTSGFNIINGHEQNHVWSMLPKGNQVAERFQQKLDKYYSKFTIKPPTYEQLRQSKAGKVNF